MDLGRGVRIYSSTATDDKLGAEQWAIGPTAVALKQTATGWTYDALANHLVSVAGNEDRADVKATFIQPFLSKALGRGRTVTLSMESTYDWEASQWNIPVNVSYSQVTKVGSQLLSWSVGARGYLETPEGGPAWGARFAITLLFPK